MKSLIYGLLLLAGVSCSSVQTIQEPSQQLLTKQTESLEERLRSRNQEWLNVHVSNDQRYEFYANVTLSGPPSLLSVHLYDLVEDQTVVFYDVPPLGSADRVLITVYNRGNNFFQGNLNPEEDFTRHFYQLLIEDLTFALENPSIIENKHLYLLPNYSRIAEMSSELFETIKKENKK